MKHSHSLRLLGLMSGVLFSLSAAPAFAGAGDGQLGMAQLGARVTAAAVVSFGSGATGALKLGTGQYEIQFNRNVTQCIYTANAFDGGREVQSLQPRSGNPNGVFLEIKTTNGANTAVDGQFYLSVFCPK